MSTNIDETDKRILRILQQDATLTAEQVADRVNLSRNACWRRIRLMEERGIVTGRVALVDPAAAGCPLTVLAMIRVGAHDTGWLGAFHRAVDRMPEIVGAYRMAGDIDYVLRIRVADVAAYDAVYKRLIAAVPLSDISATFVMEEIKETTAVPLP